MCEEGFILIFRATEYYGEYLKLNKRSCAWLPGFTMSIKSFLWWQILKKKRPNKPRCYSVQHENVSLLKKTSEIF